MKMKNDDDNDGESNDNDADIWFKGKVKQKCSILNPSCYEEKVDKKV